MARKQRLTPVGTPLEEINTQSLWAYPDEVTRERLFSEGAAELVDRLFAERTTPLHEFIASGGSVMVPANVLDRSISATCSNLTRSGSLPISG